MKTTEVINKFEVPDLTYSFDALEPHIDKRTMEIHYGKHHQGYVDKLNAAIEHTSLEAASLEELLQNVSSHNAAIRNNGGGHYNHSLFWTILAPEKQEVPKELQKILKDQFGSVEKFKEEFETTAAGRFGSGWAWLVVKDGKLAIGSTPNQDSPIMDDASFKGTPILGLDVWEHAYYLKYQNNRPTYIKAFWNIVNWDEVLRRYEEATS